MSIPIIWYNQRFFRFKDMNNSLFLPAAKTHSASIYLPGSKSISNRVLLLAALSDSQCHIKRVLNSDDTLHMKNALSALGVDLQSVADDEIIVKGSNANFSTTKADLFLGNAGTAFRPITATLAIIGGEYTLTGVARMHERPIKDLVDALRLIGADVKYLENDGFPPLSIGKFHDTNVNEISVRGDVSSQFLSALLLSLPLLGRSLTIKVNGDLISKPYIDITLNLLNRFGVSIENNNYKTFRLPEKLKYTAPKEILVEGDASGASYFFAAGLLGKKAIRVVGVDKNSIQGDIAFVDVMQQLGATVVWGDGFVEVSRNENCEIKAFDIDANHIPDAAMTLSIVALAANGTSRIRNIASWKVKETDRIFAMATELRKLGATVATDDSSITITPPKSLNENIAIDTYDDHRMAMCFSLVSLLGTPVIINNPKCVEKTFPTYFEVFNSMLE